MPSGNSVITRLGDWHFARSRLLHIDPHRKLVSDVVQKSASARSGWPPTNVRLAILPLGSANNGVGLNGGVLQDDAGGMVISIEGAFARGLRWRFE
jgi:hypothetical protein